MRSSVPRVPFLDMPGLTVHEESRDGHRTGQGCALGLSSEDGGWSGQGKKEEVRVEAVPGAGRAAGACRSIAGQGDAKGEATASSGFFSWSQPQPSVSHL